MAQNQHVDGGEKPIVIISEPKVRERRRKRLRRQKLTSNGTVAAAVMVFAALVAVVVANTPAYEAVHHLSLIHI